MRSGRRTWLRICGWVILALMALFLVALNGAGIYIGNIIYEEANIAYAKEHKTYDADRVKQLEEGKKNGNWQDAEILSSFGYSMKGTYIPNPVESDQTVVFLHGFTQNRLAGLGYLEIYRRAGYNVMLVDLRAHGDSGGESVTWGNYEKYDLNAWIDWVRARFPGGKIGVHGVSMGAATALMHAELNQSDRRVAFYIADSAYSELVPLLKKELTAKLHLEANTLLPDFLFFYGNVVSYYKEGFTFYQSSPLQSVKHVTVPVLYLHGEADTLVPPEMSEELYRATAGPKQLYTFPQAKHASSVYQDWNRYDRVIEAFIRDVQ